MRAHPGETRGLGQRDPVIRVIGGGDGRGQQFDRARVLHPFEHRPQTRLILAGRRQRARRTASGTHGLLDQGHARAGARGLEGGGDTARPRADHEHVAKAIALRRHDARRIELHFAQPREAPEHDFPAGEPALGMKRLVIEADRQETREQAEESGPVSRQTTKGIDGADPHASPQGRDVAAHVRHAVDLKHDVYIVIRARQQAPRPVILEAAAENRDARCRERRGDAVTREAGVAAAFELELQHDRTIEPLTGARLEALHHVDGSVGGAAPRPARTASTGKVATTTSRSVSRCAMNQ